MDSTNNITMQRELADIQAELLAYQKLGKDMSDYDLQYLQKRYDLKVAEIALIDAQNAKSQVRLQRDSEGNYGYIYTANQSNVDAAQEKYDTSLYNLEKWHDESLVGLSERYLSLMQEWQDELATLDKNSLEYKEKVTAINAYYSDLINKVAEELNGMLIYGQAINEAYGTHVAETFRDTILGRMYTDYETFQDLHAMVSE
jgi:hypothetical protein